MPREIRLTITSLPVNETLLDNGGSWSYAGGIASVDGAPYKTATLQAEKRLNFAGTSFLPAATTLTATILFPADPGKPGTVGSNITLQGVHDTGSNNESGSVSAASSEFTAYIGGTFSFDFTKKLIVIEPRGY